MSLAAAMLLPLASCEDNHDSDMTTLSVKIAAYNLVTSIDDDASKPVTVSLNNYVYNFTFANSGNTVALQAGPIAIPGGTAAFTTIPLSSSARMLNVDGQQREVIKFSAESPTESGAKVADLNGLLTQAVFMPGSAEIPGYKLEFPGGTGHIAVLDYKMEDLWRVRTFWNDVTFTGATTTTYKDKDENIVNFENKNIRYRVVMKSDKGILTGKADVILYNAKFAETAPEITVVLQDLDLTFSAAGYKISGKDVVPFMVEANALQPTPRFIFNNFELSAVDDLTQATINFKVAGIYDGTFKGACIAK